MNCTAHFRALSHSKCYSITARQSSQRAQADNVRWTLSISNYIILERRLSTPFLACTAPRTVSPRACLLSAFLNTSLTGVCQQLPIVPNSLDLFVLYVNKLKIINWLEGRR